MDTALILNPRSGSGGGYRFLRSYFDRLGGPGVGRCRVLVTRGPREAQDLAIQCVKEGFEVVVAVGGDGTINEVASSLVGTDVKLGVIPLGSGNGLARALGIPLRPLDAAKALLSGRCVKMDAGKCGDRFFFSTAGTGLDAEVAYGYMKYFGSIRGPLPYFLLTAAKLFAFRPAEIRLACDELVFRGAPILLAVCNTGHYGCGAIISPRAHYGDGMLHISLLEKVNPILAARYIVSLFKGTIDKMPKVKTLSTRKVTIGSVSPLTLQLDGEPVRMSTPVELEIVPSALNVLVP